MTTVVGKHNPRLAEVRKALRRGTLTSDGLLPLEGPHLVGEALSSGVEVHELLVVEGVEPVAGIPANRVRRIGAPSFRSLARTRESQGMVALVTAPGPRLEETFDRVARARPADASYGPILVVCGIQDPGNAGTILRSAEAFGSAGVVATPGTVGCYNDKVVRASAGSILRLPWAWNVDLETFCAAARGRGIRIIGATADGDVALASVDFRTPTAVLIGSEGGGLSTAERALAETLVRIPLRAPVESLNAAAAATVILYEAAGSLPEAVR